MKKTTKVILIVIAVILIIIVALLVYYLYFNRQKNSAKESNKSEINYCLENHDQELIEKVKNEPKVTEFLNQTFPAGNTPKVEVDNKTGDEITVHVYEIVGGDSSTPGHTATMDWYYLNCKGEITGSMF